MTAHELVIHAFSPFWEDEIIGSLWDLAKRILEDDSLTDEQRLTIMEKRCEEIRQVKHKGYPYDQTLRELGIYEND